MSDISRANDMVYPLDHSVNIAPNGTIQCGLTIRENFAAMAMQGLLAGECTGERWTTQGVATKAVAIADALIAELAKSEQS